MPTFIPPYTVTVTSTIGGLSQCTYMDGNGESVPSGAPLTTSTPEGQEGTLAIEYWEATVSGEDLRLVGAAVKTVGNDPTMNPYNYLPASRTNTPNGWMNGVVIPWGADMYTTRGVVLLFAQVDDDEMVNFYPSADPQTQNTKPPSAS